MNTIEPARPSPQNDRIDGPPGRGRAVYAYADSTAYGGAERALGTLLVGLAATGWRPHLLHSGAAEIEPLLDTIREHNITERTLPGMPEGLVGAARVPALARILREERPAVFHAHQTWPISCKWALAAACLARVPAIVATAQLFVEVPMGRSRRVQLSILSRGIDRVLAVSRDTRRGWINRLGWPADRVEVVPNAIEVDVEVADADVATARAELDDESGRPLALVPARLDHGKGHEYLLDAAERLPNVRFVCVGDGPFHERLVRKATDRGVAERVTFLGFRRDMPVLLRAADMVVLPSLYEGLPLSLIEAMVAGRPVVATAVGGTPELVVDGETGLLLPPRDPVALADAVDQVASDATLAAELGSAGAERARRRFSSRAMVAAVATHYEEILA